MARSVRAFLPLAGAPERLVHAFERDPGRWLPASRRDAAHWMVRIRAGALSREVRAEVGSPWVAGATHWRSLTWDPLADPDETIAVERFLPTFDGELGLHLDGSDRVTLVLDARYRPPGGALGAAIDAMALHRVALRTVERLLEDIGARLMAEAMHIEVATRSTT